MSVSRSRGLILQGWEIDPFVYHLGEGRRLLESWQYSASSLWGTWMEGMWTGRRALPPRKPLGLESLVEDGLLNGTAAILVLLAVC